MIVDDINIGDTVPEGKAVVYERLKDKNKVQREKKVIYDAHDVFIVSIGRTVYHSEKIESVVITIPKNNNLETDAKRIGSELLKYNVKPLFNIKETSSDNNRIKRISEQEIAFLTQYLQRKQ
jgi:hypothetical protein